MTLHDPATLAECGTVLVALTDADGDFLNYTVDVLSLELETANGRIVETLPRSTRINFTDYVDLTELVTAASYLPQLCIAAPFVSTTRMPKFLLKLQTSPNRPWSRTWTATSSSKPNSRFRLSNRDRLVVMKGRAALLQLDFDLAASHTVDIVPTPAEAVRNSSSSPKCSPSMRKTFGSVARSSSVSEDDMTYTVAIRPFHDRDGRLWTRQGARDRRNRIRSQ